MFLLLLILWIVLNGRVTVELVLVGAAVSAALTCFTRKLFPGSLRLKKSMWRCLPGVLGYLVYVVLQVVSANVQVMGRILHPDARRPVLVWFQVPLKGELPRLVLANSITLTPGTVTVSLGKDTLCVYALRPELAEGLKDCGFATRLKRLEEKDHG